MYQREINTVNMEQTSRFLVKHMFEGVANCKHQTPCYITSRSGKSQCLFFFKYFSLHHWLSNHGIVRLSFVSTEAEKKHTVTIAYNVTTKGSYRRHASVGIIVSTTAKKKKDTCSSLSNTAHCTVHCCTVALLLRKQGLPVPRRN